MVQEMVMGELKSGVGEAGKKLVARIGTIRAGVGLLSCANYECGGGCVRARKGRRWLSLNI